MPPQIWNKKNAPILILIPIPILIPILILILILIEFPSLPPDH